MNRHLVLAGIIATVVAVGCGNKKTPAAAPAAQVTCTLDCSGNEKTATGDSVEEVRAVLTAMVEATCNPDDGQHFITCEEGASAPGEQP